MVARRLLMALAAVATGLVSVPYIAGAVLAAIGGGQGWRVAFAYGVLAFGLGGAFILLTIAAIRPRSLIRAMGAALTVGPLLLWGMSVQPGSATRVLLHLAAVLGLVALLIQVIQGIGDRRRGLLWILPVLLVGLAIGFVAGGLIGLHIVTQYCRFPRLGAEVSSILCSG